MIGTTSSGTSYKLREIYAGAAVMFPHINVNFAMGK
jgi:hypothetical protein